MKVGSSDLARFEYEQLCESMRHYSNMRFAQLTLYFAMTGGLVALLYGPAPPASLRLRLLLLVVGAVIAAAFGVMDDRATAYYRHFRDRAAQLEKPLDFQAFSTRPRARYLTATNACRLLTWGGATIWTVAIVVVFLNAE